MPPLVSRCKGELRLWRSPVRILISYLHPYVSGGVGESVNDDGLDAVMAASRQKSKFTIDLIDSIRLQKGRKGCEMPLYLLMLE